MDHLIQDHEKRQRYWRSGRIPEIDIINNNGNSNSASSQLIHKLLAITISITAAWITRIAWLQKASIVIKALGIIIVIIFIFIIINIIIMICIRYR